MEKTYGTGKVVEVEESDESRLSAANVTDISMQNMITNFMMDNTRIDSKRSKNIVDIHSQKSDLYRTTPYSMGYMKNSARFAENPTLKLSSRVKN